MAHNTINLSSVMLIDRWPGVVNPNISIPTCGWDNTLDNFETASGCTAPTYQVGTKIMAYTDNTYCPGWYEMMYLQYHSFETACISRDFSNSVQLCTPFDGSTAENSCVSTTPYYVVTNEVTVGNSDMTRNCMLAIPCFTLSSDGTSAYTNGYGDSYGWFWIGGVCPCKDATLLDGTSGTGIGVAIDCGSSYKGGPLKLDMTGSRLFFETGQPSIEEPLGNVNQLPYVAYGCTSGV